MQLFFFAFLESRSFVYFCRNSFVSLFIEFFVPSKVIIEVSAKFWFLHKNRFFVSQTFPSPFVPSRPGKNSKWSEFFCVILICLRNFNYSSNCRFEPRKCLETIRLYGLFCFDRFCLFFCILYFAVFCVVFFASQVLSSCSLCIEVLGVFVSRLNMRIFDMH